MQINQGKNRHQSYFSTLENQVAADNGVKQYLQWQKTTACISQIIARLNHKKV
jgi:hypothetical protein